MTSGVKQSLPPVLAPKTGAEAIMRGRELTLAEIAVKDCKLDRDVSIVTRRNYFTDYKNRRGMSVYHDWIDWIGGYPFEVAKVEEILEFYHPHGFTLDNLRTTNRLGCNQFVFVRNTTARC